MIIIGKDVIELISQAIMNSIEFKLNNAKFNRTVSGRVKEQLGDNKYLVTINGKDYTVKSHFIHVKNEVVKIVVCNNNWGDLYVLY